MSDLLPPPREAFGSLGRGSVFGPMCRVDGPASIFLGTNVKVMYGARWSVTGASSPEARVTVADGSHVGRYSRLLCRRGISIGRDVLTSDHVFISDHYPGPLASRLPEGPVTIGDGAFVGWGAAILPGVTVGDGAYVAAAAVVMDDVPPHAVVAGNPARVITEYDSRAAQWVPAGR